MSPSTISTAVPYPLESKPLLLARTLAGKRDTPRKNDRYCRNSKNRGYGVRIAFHRFEMTRRTLFPEIEPFETGRLAVNSLHHLYWEQSGNLGVPVVFLHGGPGAGAVPAHRRFFDPRSYRIVIFDQRGAGRSTPLGGLADNTTSDLVEDIEKLRWHLGIDRWFVFGGSWGSSLALASRTSVPGPLPRPCLARHIPVPKKTRSTGSCTVCAVSSRKHGLLSPITFQYRTRRSPWKLPSASDRSDPKIHLPAARVWSRYEGSCSTLRPNPGAVSSFIEPATALSGLLGSKRTILSTIALWTKDNCSTTSRASPASQVSSCKAATTLCVRS